jgi:exopolysaccharide biosynthesis polyprenyl glycosylphosphotransferase
MGKRTTWALGRSPVREQAARAAHVEPPPLRRPLLAVPTIRFAGSARGPLLRRLLALADVLAVLLASSSLALAAGIDAALWPAVFLPFWIVLAKLHGLYDRDHRSLRHLTVDELPGVFGWALTSSAFVTLLSLLVPEHTLDLRLALQLWLVVAIGALVLRSSARTLMHRLTHPEQAIIIGGGPLAEAARRKLELFPDIHVELVDEPRELPLEDVCADNALLARLDRIILASQTLDEHALAALLAVCRRNGLKLSVVPPARGIFGTAVHLNHVAELPVIEYNTWDISRSTLMLKRALDLSVAGLALALSAPLLATIAVAVKVDSPGPAIFRQRRAGAGGREFTMLKFRTMASDAEERLAEAVSFDSLRDPMFKLRHDPRVTRVGRFLRRTSLDELPQLANVLAGDMSLVGPRPEQLELVERYRPEHRFRLAVKPGMTGPMQVYGRGELTFEERLAVEREYIENLSLGRDFRILALTFAAVISGRGAF